MLGNWSACHAFHYRAHSVDDRSGLGGAEGCKGQIRRLIRRRQVRSFFALVVLLCLASAAPAFASSAKKAAPEGGAEISDRAETKEEAARRLGAPSTPNIDMPGLVAPVVVDGELKRYVYISLNLKIRDRTQRSKVLEKVPYLQDAFLREVHRGSIAKDNDPTIVDEPALIARLMGVCDRVAGTGSVTEITIVRAIQSGF
jgi:hypothetical protein